MLNEMNFKQVAKNLTWAENQDLSFLIGVRIRIGPKKVPSILKPNPRYFRFILGDLNRWQGRGKVVNVRKLVIEREMRNIGVQSLGEENLAFIFRLFGPRRLPSMVGELDS